MTRRRKPRPEPVVAEQPMDILSLSHDARGVGRTADNKTVFVRDALPGERVSYSVYKKHSQYDEADTVELLSASDERVTPHCEYFGYCGGCALQHLDPEKQIDYKQHWLADQLHKFAKCEPEVWAPPLRGQFWGYRYKARLGVKWVPAKERVLVGFREKKGRYLADIEHCEILHPQVGHNLMALSAMIEQLSIYQQCPQIEVAATDDQVALNFRVLSSPSEEDLAILAAFGETHGFAIYLQPKGPLTTFLHYAPTDYEQLAYRADAETELFFQPYQFTQVNPIINRDMIAQAMDWMQLSKQSRVLDLFCGIGNFSLPIAQCVAHVTGVEGDATAIESAKTNAAHNQLGHNTDFHVANLFEDQAHTAWAKADYSHVLLDPPRSGAIEVLPLLTQCIKPQMILYVSCNPATLARDIGELIPQGYRVVRAGVMDMFPHTAHVESMALLQREA